MKLTNIESYWHLPALPKVWTGHRLLKKSARVISSAPELCVALDEATLNEIRRFRKDAYKFIYPQMDLDNDPLDYQSIVYYQRGADGKIASTARLAFDGRYPLPEEEFLQEYREKNWRLAEWGRFAIDEGDISLLKAYYRAMYTTARQCGCQAIVMAMKPQNISMHQRLMGIKVIRQDTGVTYGGPYSLACVVWELESTKSRFFNWIGSNKK